MLQRHRLSRTRPPCPRCPLSNIGRSRPDIQQGRNHRLARGLHAEVAFLSGFGLLHSALTIVGFNSPCNCSRSYLSAFVVLRDIVVTATSRGAHTWVMLKLCKPSSELSTSGATR